MKKIIDGKMYDTTTAKCLADADSGHLPGDFEFWAESLYRTKSGNFFLRGEGGGNSKYGEWRGNSGGPGEKIIPLSESGAREWAERELDGDGYEGIFGRLEEDTVVLSMSIPESLRDRFIAEREKVGVTSARLLEDLLNAAEEK